MQPSTLALLRTFRLSFCIALRKNNKLTQPLIDQRPNKPIV
jgi:hypothetical protein